MKRKAERKEPPHTWGKHIGIPPRIAFGGLKIACKKHRYSEEGKKEKKKKDQKYKKLW